MQGYSLIEKHRIRISIGIVLLIMSSSLQLVDSASIQAQEDVGSEDLLCLDNVTISTDLFSTCLEVMYTRCGEIIDITITDLDSKVVLLLSLNNESWVEAKQHTLADDSPNETITRVIRICNSVSEAFPFNVEEGETLYVCIEYWYRSRLELGYRIFRTASLAIVVPVDIIRPWHLTLDLRLPGILGVILLFSFTVYFIRRRRITITE